MRHGATFAGLGEGWRGGPPDRPPLCPPHLHTRDIKRDKREARRAVRGDTEAMIYLLLNLCFRNPGQDLGRRGTRRAHGGNQKLCAGDLQPCEQLRFQRTEMQLVHLGKVSAENTFYSLTVGQKQGGPAGGSFHWALASRGSIGKFGILNKRRSNH